MKNVLVVDNPDDWPWEIPGCRLMSNTEYVTTGQALRKGNYRVYNLCRSFHYQSTGYYVSLLAAARRHKPIPSIETILDMESHPLVQIRSQAIQNLIQESLKDSRTGDFELDIIFGRSYQSDKNRLAAAIHQLFPAPLLRAQFTKDSHWQLADIRPLAIEELQEVNLETIQGLFMQYFKRRIKPFSPKPFRFSLAILVNPEESLPPSNERSIKKFVKAAEKLEVETELIGPQDFHRLAEFDGLFIRETTQVNHHTFRFSQKAQALGLVVMDDPDSILKCTNKVYLNELLDQHQLPKPRSWVVHPSNMEELMPQLPLPCVLKKPDSCFSVGVVKVKTQKDLASSLSSMLEDSDLVMVQEYIPTSFDWRVGVIGGKAFYVCKYFMAKKHWQIYKATASGKLVDGRSETLALDDVPAELIQITEKAASLIGDGLYGIDIKELDGRYYIIEINDNPSLDAGCEDLVLKDQLYEAVMQVFFDRMAQRVKGSQNGRY
ncbi:MAG: RimK family protein [Oligoflexus sp.]